MVNHSNAFSVVPLAHPIGGTLYLRQKENAISTLVISGVLALMAPSKDVAGVALAEGMRWDQRNGEACEDIIATLTRIRGGLSDPLTMMLACTSFHVWGALANSANTIGRLPINERGPFAPTQCLEMFNLDGIVLLDDCDIPKTRRTEAYFAAVDADMIRMSVIRNVINIPK